jgi:hypothetical protein
MATGKGKNRTRKEDNDQDAASSNDDYKDLPENDQQTLRLVKLVKVTLKFFIQSSYISIYRLN